MRVVSLLARCEKPTLVVAAVMLKLGPSRAWCDGDCKVVPVAPAAGFVTVIGEEAK